MLYRSALGQYLCSGRSSVIFDGGITLCEQSAPVPTEVDVRDKALQEAVRVGAATRPTLEDVHCSLKVLEGIGAARQIGDHWETTESIVVRTGAPR